MTHFEVGFRLQHDCPMTEISQRYPEAVIARWCQYENDVIEASFGGVADPQRFKADFKRAIRGVTPRPAARAVDTKHGLQLVAKCDHASAKTSLTRYFVKHRCLEIYPAIYTDGWEWYRMVALSGANVKDFFDDVDRTCRVEILSKTREVEAVHDMLTLSMSNILGSLTQKQARALYVALRDGYYFVPKRASTRALADTLGVPRTTYEEHLRKAESKVMSSLGPYVRLQEGQAGPVRGRRA